MKIGIDAHAGEKDGSGNCTYIRGLLSGLSAIDQENEYILYITDQNHPFYDKFKTQENFHLKQLRPKSPLLRIPLSLAKETFSDDLDVLHVQYIAPPIHRGKLVVTIHDLAFIHFPESFSRLERLRSRILIRRNAGNAARIITGSHYSKNDIQKIYKINPMKIEVTPYGAPFLPHPVISFEERERILRKYRINSKFLFSLSRLNVRKNLKSLIQAFAELKRKRIIDWKLVIGGKKDYLFEEAQDEMKLSGCAEDIILTGFIPEDDLPALYSSAEAFLYPSVFEGFGFPPLEAMACGCPVVTSNVTSLPEVVGDTALLINPFDTEEIINAVYRIISDENLKKRMKSKGLERARLFRWKDTAAKTLQVYRDVFQTE